MTQKSLSLAVLACILSIYGCSNDSSIQGDTRCTNNSDCESGICLGSGECGVSVGEGEECDKTHVCKKGFSCQEGVCEEKGGPTDECTTNDDCDDGFICENEECVKEDEDDVIKRECTSNDDCGDHKTCVGSHCVVPQCTSNEDCGGDKKCVSGSCRTSDGKCTADPDCAMDPDTPNCLADGSCGRYVDLGQICGDSTQCKSPYKCNYTCYEELGKDASCDPDDENRICADSMKCVNGHCNEVVYNVKAGEECNDSYLFCDSSLECQNGKCVQISGRLEECDEANNIMCDTGLICTDSQCVPIGKPCTSSKDCTTTDSFCCLEDSCGAKGFCIPYDETITHDETCKFQTKPGIFEAQVQCRWQPPAKDKYKTSTKVEMHPLVGHFGNTKNLPTIVAFYSYDKRSETATDDEVKSVLRFIHPETCETLESLQVNLAHWWNNYPAAADLNGDGLFEIIVSSNKVIEKEGGEKEIQYYPKAYIWDNEKKKHKVYWTSKVQSNGALSVYDIDGDGLPEVIAGTTVINGQTGDKIFAGSSGEWYTYAIGNLDRDPKGIASQVRKSGVYKWNPDKKKWKEVITFKEESGFHTAYADFGTPGDTPEDFDFYTLDGLPEFALTSNGKVNLFASHKNASGVQESQLIMTLTLLKASDGNTSAKGGPITIGDFNNDGLPEMGIASSGYFGVYDPKCKGYEAGKCADEYVLWERWSQDASSGRTGSSLFDFDGDGQSEAVYADECFTRVYEGKTGRVLFSARRSSSTSIEAPVIADIDNDGSAEILMGSDTSKNCYNDTSQKTVEYNKSNAVDPIHEGIRCMGDEDCPKSKNCDKNIGLCLCESDDDCNTQYMTDVNGKEILVQQYVCAEPIHPQVGLMANVDESGRNLLKPRGTRPDGWSEGDYHVCRATRKYKEIGEADLMIFKDRLDRWVSSRNVWNQHGYNIINIEDDGSMPSIKKWLANWLLKDPEKKITQTGSPAPVYNNYRLNSQGKYGANTAPDITGRFISGSICGTSTNDEGEKIHVISGKLCNRGTKPVAKQLPASFFFYDESKPNQRGEWICTSFTKSTVGSSVTTDDGLLCQHIRCLTILKACIADRKVVSLGVGYLCQHPEQPWVGCVGIDNLCVGVIFVSETVLRLYQQSTAACQIDMLA